MTEHVRPSCSTGKLRILIRSSLFSYLILPLVLVQLCSNLASAGSPVKFLPGFEGPLPFELETGYIGVDESEDVQLFYYFVKSESSPETDPLVLWLTGGNCCTSFSGLAYEIGPIKFEQVLYHGTLPKLLLNPYSWTKVASIIFVDLPVASGFSYARTAKASQSTVLQACNQAYEFLRKWLVDHPEFISSPVYIGGDSYSGITVPIVTQIISDGNEVGIEPHIDLKGYLLGNPTTTPGDGNYAIQFAHGMGLISDELYESLKLSCKGEYQNIDPSNALCLQNMQAYNQLLTNIDTAHILEPDCPYASPKPNNLFIGRRSTIQVFCKKTRELKIQELTAPFTCRMDGYRLAYHWANDESVQEALHVRKGSIGEWIRCNCRYPYIRNIGTSLPYHANLSIRGYRSLIYSGDHDMVVPHFGTQAWIKSLNYSIIDDWRQWILQGQVAGYTRAYANKMTFATVKGGGHTAPEYRPAECQAMFERGCFLIKIV
ncbi:serine carboxypeptidase-like 7 isoform X1 [Coffea arabica]|uniref:Serine carboxypeptidase-like 7 isoform X1 n=1 Tax=Coffea arabica TaxID=13443 RepID=A0A6P6UWG7_COFAR|nr:serine carboxypeptidase-like 7 isoform X1 [Coffea arabica]